MALAEETIATFMAALAQRLPRCFQLSTKMDGSKDGIQDRRVLTVRKDFAIIPWIRRHNTKCSSENRCRIIRNINPETVAHRSGNFVIGFFHRREM
ncbi:hypothetical protein T10_9435 [Trichinella papuae]|uniref:Uncharacterized protein n=1 Tax=Trichinella papuae TaxID=268474 RepID=A0A0V1M622_9BILA|nr:hypothetical protein T10_9435 [Trichinella papuae]